jgi:hypothetical protein
LTGGHHAQVFTGGTDQAYFGYPDGLIDSKLWLGYISLLGIKEARLRLASGLMIPQRQPIVNTGQIAPYWFPLHSDDRPVGYRPPGLRV